jgi:uncharacterized membrane protein
MTRLRAFWESVRTTYWAVPSLMAVSAAGVSGLMIHLDEVSTPRFLGTLPWVYAGGPEGARAVLSTIAGSMITVAGVTFSITIVALTLASQQFGPRLLRGFLRDLGNQVVLGTFVSTFLYCLLVLRTVRGIDDSQFVPHLAVTFGVLLAMISLGVLIFFIHHVSVSIQASQIIANVAADLSGAVARLFPDELGHARTPPHAGVRRLPDDFDRNGRTISATASGYVQAIDGDALLALTAERDAVLRIDVTPGRFVHDGATLLVAWPPARADGAFCEAARAAFIIGSARMPTQDVQFFVEQLVELAVRALSPGINDPGTARMCLDRLGQMLCQMATREMPATGRCDGDGRLRLVTKPVTFEDMAATAFDEIRRYGRSSVSVTIHLLDIIGEIGGCVTRDSDRRALLQHADAIMVESRETAFGDADRTLVQSSYHAARAALRAPHKDRSGDRERV